MRALMSLDSLDLTATDRAGRKAATLGWLKQSGFAVPDGQVLDASWFDAWSRGALDHDALQDAVSTALADLGPGPIAVRSSGIREDGNGTSMAGCFDTTLGVLGAEQAIQAVVACYESARRARSQLQLDAGGMAALLQRQVEPAAAGVAFTADPVTGERDVVCIEATSGLADELMSGTADGESWRVGGQTRRKGADRGVLSSEQAEQVARVARSVAQTLGCPSDVEWALADGEVVVIQARPITALPAAPIPIDEPVPPGAWKRDDHCRVATPLSWAAWYRHYPDALTEVFKNAGAPFERLESRRIRGQVYGRLVTGGPDGPPPPGPLLWLASRLMPTFRRGEKLCKAFLTENKARQYLDQWDTEWVPELTARCKELLAVDLQAMSDQQLVAHLEEGLELGKRGGLIHAFLGAGHSVPIGLLCWRGEQWLGWTDLETCELIAGYSTGTTQVDLDLADIAAPWADDPRLHEGTLDDVRAALPDLAAALDEWRAWEGFRRLDYDLSERTLAEADEVVLARMRAGVTSRKRLDEVREAALAQAEARLQMARDALSPEQLAIFEPLVQDARKAAQNRDSNALLSHIIPSGIVRLGALEVGRRLVERGRLDSAEHTWFLYPEEWTGALAGEWSELTAEVTRRRGEHSWARANPGPVLLGDHYPDPDPKWMPTYLGQFFRIMSRMDAPPPTGEGLCGMAAGGGVTTGTARVLHSVDELHRLRPGDVLICECTGASWAVAFGVIGAIITERGGTLSHPAILAREYGLPAVLGVPDATKRIEDGQQIRVDGNTGRVEVL